MATIHVFIVDNITFKYHLEYLFAGTGAKDSRIDFNSNPSTKLHHAIENNLVGMIADSQRIRKGDFILFYLQQNISQDIYEGKFYGIFKAKNDFSFLDNNDAKQFLTGDKQHPYYKDLVNSFKDFNRANRNCLPLKYIEFDLTNNKLNFKEIKY